MAIRVLVTGGTGTLGRHVVALLDARPGAGLRVLCRRQRPPEASPTCEWFRGDLADDALEPALRDVDVVLHLASVRGGAEAICSPPVGCSRPPRRRAYGTSRSCPSSAATPSRCRYYASKMRIERAARESGVPWSIARVAQFHSFVDRLVRTAATVPVPTPIVADLRFQPVDEDEAAAHLVKVALAPAAGDAPEIAGPEVLTLGEIAETWLTVTGRPATLVPVPLDALRFDAPGSPAPVPRARQHRRLRSQRDGALRRRPRSGRRDELDGDVRARSAPHRARARPRGARLPGEDGRGLGASHQTGWTALVAELLRARAHSALRRSQPGRGER